MDNKRKKRTIIKPNDVFGRLIVLKFVGLQNSHRTFEVRCDCGIVKIVKGTHMISGAIRSCGCLHSEVNSKEPGMSGYTKFFNQYRSNARNRKLCFEFTFEKFIEIISKSCFYCNKKPRKYNPYLKEDGSLFKGEQLTKKGIERAWILINGIDRKNNLLGYTIDNSLPCCSKCNEMKSDMSFEEFTYHVNSITINLGRQQ